MLEWLSELDQNTIVSITSTVSMALVSILTSAISSYVSLRSMNVQSKHARMDALRNERMTLYSDTLAAATRCNMILDGSCSPERIDAMLTCCAKSYMVASEDLRNELHTMQEEILMVVAKNDNKKRIEAAMRIDKVSKLMKDEIDLMWDTKKLFSKHRHRR